MITIHILNIQNFIKSKMIEVSTIQYDLQIEQNIQIMKTEIIDKRVS